MCNGSANTTGAPCIVDNAGDRRLPIGIEDFEEVVSTRVYVDKTLLIRELLDADALVTLFCRPRRFGKSLAMRMLQCYLEAPVEGYVPDRRSLFANLAIWGAGEKYRAEQGAYPTVYLSLGAVCGATWEAARGVIASKVAAEYLRHWYLVEDGTVRPVELPVFERIASGDPSENDLRRSLCLLVDLLVRRHGGHKAVILIDEYDRPVTEGHLNGFRDEATAFMRAWLTDALKGTVNLKLACLTGVQRVSKESIFSDFNNLAVDTPLDCTYRESFGFTEPEAEGLARLMGRGDSIEEMRAWYDGYSSGGTRVYNPISTLNYVRQGVAQPYWANTSGNEVVTRLFQRADAATDAALRRLAEGGEVVEPLDMQVVFGQIDSDTHAVWSQLYLAGYLTTDDVGESALARKPRRLRVPNREVRELFGTEFLDRAQRLATGGRLRELHAALLAGDPERFAGVLGLILESSPSFRDLSTEAACHMFLMGMLYEVPGYRYPVSNRESGLGYSDILLVPAAETAARLPVIAIEVKRARTSSGDDVRDEAALQRHAHDVALHQAVDRRYGAEFDGAGRVLWGVSFSGKRAACAVERPAGEGLAS